MNVRDIQVVGNLLAIAWSDGGESFIELEELRKSCPCAGCKGEMDVMGNLYRSETVPLKPESTLVTRLQPVGGYGVQPVWGDGHSTGLYSWDYLRKLASSAR